MSGSGPVAKIEDYPLDVAIWANEGDSGRYYNVSLQRTYTVTDAESGKKEYKRTTQLRKQDICAAAALLTQAYHRIRQLEKQDRA